MKPADWRPGTQNTRRLRRTIGKPALCVLRCCASQPASTHGAYVFLVATRTVARACAEKKTGFPLVRQAARTRELLLIRTPLLLALCAPACGAWLAIGAALPVTALFRWWLCAERNGRRRAADRNAATARQRTKGPSRVRNLSRAADGNSRGALVV